MLGTNDRGDSTHTDAHGVGPGGVGGVREELEENAFVALGPIKTD